VLARLEGARVSKKQKDNVALVVTRRDSERPLHVLVISSGWPTPEEPHQVPFIVQQVECLRAAGAQVDVFPFYGRKNPLRYLAAWWNLRRQHRLRDYDVIHAHFGQAGLIAWPASVPLVVTFHGSDVQGIVGADGRYRPSSRVLQAVSRFAARRADAVIAVSERVRSFLPERNATHVIPGGVDLDVFRPMDQRAVREQIGMPLDGRCILFAASPTNPVKRFDLAEAAVRCVQETMDVDLHVLQGVPHDQVPLHMNACDALLLTSRHEGSPTVVKEALACNLPVVSVDVGDVRERIGDVPGCVVCEDDAPATIAEALQFVLARASFTAGRPAVASLDKHRVAARVLDVYRSLIPFEKASPVA
jgi:glycosyltransferase involved in cell wall biosynthesis